MARSSPKAKAKTTPSKAKPAKAATPTKKPLPVYPFTLLYMLSIPFMNWVFIHSPALMLPDGTPLSVAVFLVGAIFILRDFSQREVGTYGALGAMGIAGVITWFMATPALAIASVGAFAVSELVDWTIYTFTKRPLSERILYSSLIACPVDTAIFLAAAEPILPGLNTVSALVLYSLCKVLVAIALYFVLEHTRFSRLKA